MIENGLLALGISLTCLACIFAFQQFIDPISDENVVEQLIETAIKKELDIEIDLRKNPPPKRKPISMVMQE